MKKFSFAALVSTALLIFACSPATKERVQEQVMETHVLKKSDVEPLSPDSVIMILIEGNERFVQKNPTQRDVLEQIKESSDAGQNPLAIVLSCIDSRVPVEFIFDKGAGDLFVARQAGNVIDEDILGSMEYACEHAGSKVIVVMGHEHCGAVHAAVEHVEAGNMTQMLAKIRPAIDSCMVADVDTDSEEFLANVTRKNVDNMIKQIRRDSEILNEMEEEGKIKIVGAIFYLNSGKVEFI